MDQDVNMYCLFFAIDNRQDETNNHPEVLSYAETLLSRLLGSDVELPCGWDKQNGKSLTFIVGQQ